MDPIRKRIIVILLITVIGIGIGVGIFSFYVFQGYYSIVNESLIFIRKIKRK